MAQSEYVLCISDILTCVMCVKKSIVSFLYILYIDILVLCNAQNVIRRNQIYTGAPNTNPDLNRSPGDRRGAKRPGGSKGREV